MKVGLSLAATALMVGALAAPAGAQTPSTVSYVKLTTKHTETEKPGTGDQFPANSVTDNGVEEHYLSGQLGRIRYTYRQTATGIPGISGSSGWSDEAIDANGSIRLVDSLNQDDTFTKGDEYNLDQRLLRTDWVANFLAHAHKGKNLGATTFGGKPATRYAVIAKSTSKIGGTSVEKTNYYVGADGQPLGETASQNVHHANGATHTSTDVEHVNAISQLPLGDGSILNVQP